MMKLDNYEYAHPYFIDLLRCMMMMDSKSYTRATLMMMCLMKYHKKNDTPMWNMVKNNLGCINEEPCELSFSCLASAAVVDTVEDKASYLSELYGLMPVARQCVSDFNDDVGVGGTSGSSYIRISKKGEEVKACGTFFADKIRRIKLDSKIAYPTEFFKQAQRKAKDVRGLVEIKGEDLYCGSVNERVPAVADKIKALMNTWWCQTERTDVWGVRPAQASDHDDDITATESDARDSDGVSSVSTIRSDDDNEAGSSHVMQSDKLPCSPANDPPQSDHARAAVPVEEESNEPNHPNISEFDSDAFWSDDYVVQGRNSEEGEDLMDEGSDELEGDKKDTVRDDVGDDDGMSERDEGEEVGAEGEEGKYWVESIEGEFMNNGTKYVKVKWWGEKELTLETLEHMTNQVPELVKIYQRKRRKKISQRRRKKRKADPPFRPDPAQGV